MVSLKNTQLYFCSAKAVIDTIPKNGHCYLLKKKKKLFTKKDDIRRNFL